MGSVLWLVVLVCVQWIGALDELLEPTLLISVLVRNKAHVLPYFLGTLDALDYPKHRIQLFIRLDHSVDDSAEMLDRWLGRLSFGGIFPRRRSHRLCRRTQLVRLDRRSLSGGDPLEAVRFGQGSTCLGGLFVVFGQRRAVHRPKRGATVDRRVQANCGADAHLRRCLFELLGLHHRHRLLQTYRRLRSSADQTVGRLFCRAHGQFGRVDRLALAGYRQAGLGAGPTGRTVQRSVGRYAAAGGVGSSGRLAHARQQPSPVRCAVATVGCGREFGGRVGQFAIFGARIVAQWSTGIDHNSTAGGDRAAGAGAGGQDALRRALLDQPSSPT
ncbi:glycosyltransferase 25 family member [Trichinella spiralis]|uniref:glycosyltransferase 25 family member n=1 Tax=Trichinella spiralis TaxID=6334 RepID=UPI0001EFC8B8|nr:glycosyltransferase 25 family member [Trichinella spiralis]